MAPIRIPSRPLASLLRLVATIREILTTGQVVQSPAKSSTSSPKPHRQLKSACLSLQPCRPIETAAVQDQTARDPKLASSQGTQDLGPKAYIEGKRRRPSSWDPLARYYSEAHSFPDYGWLKELNGSTAGGLNTLTNPPPPSLAPYPPGGSPRPKRHKPNDPKDSSRSRYFPTTEPETHDLTYSDSQEDPYDLRSNSSTGKPMVARVGVKEYRNAQPKNNAARPRTRKSRSSIGNHRLLDAAGKGRNTNLDLLDRSENPEALDTLDVLAGHDDPPPSNVRSDLARVCPKRTRSECYTETSSSHFKRPRVHQQNEESIDSEDELSRDQYREKPLPKNLDLFNSKRTSTRGDIRPTQFLRTRPNPSYATPSPEMPLIHVRRAVSGKHTFPGTGEDGEVVLQSVHGGSPLLSPKCTLDAKSSLGWLAIDLDKVTQMEHAATHSHFIHVLRPRSNNFESNLWLQMMDHRDVMSLVRITKSNQLKEVPASQLDVKWQQAWNNAKNYQNMNPARSSASTPGTQQNELQMGTNQRQSDKDDTNPGPRRPVKLIDQMRASMTDEKGSSIGTPEEEVSAVAKAPGRRRTRRSSPVHILEEEQARPERWTDQTPDWRARWHQSLVFPATGKNRATVDDDDILRLDEGEFLNDNLISFYIRYLQFKLESERPELISKIYFFSTFFFEKLRSTKGKVNYDGVKAWTAKVDLFSYDYIVVPVNEHAHWYLAVICNAPNAIKGIPREADSKDNPEHVDVSSPRIAAIERDMSDVVIRDGDTKQQSADVEIIHSPPSSAKTMQNSSPVSKTIATASSQTSTATPRHHDPRAPRIITLDSLASSHPTTCRALREYLIAEAKDKRGVDLVETPQGMTAKKVPEQDNFCDCGVFVLGYMQEFLKDPGETVRKLLQKEPLGWDIRPSQLRNSLRDLLFELQREQHERQIKEKEEKRLLSAKKKPLAKDANLSTRGASDNVQLTPSRKPSVVELPGASDVMTVSRNSPVARAAVEQDARSSPMEPVATSPGGRLSEDGAPVLRPPRVVPRMDNNDGASGTVGPGSSSMSHDSLQGGMAVSGKITPVATRATMATMEQDMNEKDFVQTLPISSSEAEVQETRRAPKKFKRTSMPSTDVEEVMSISRSRPTTQISKQLESSTSLIPPMGSSQRSSPPSPQAKYVGIERTLDLT
ncbi:hypothetical protein E4U41_000889 [Claviceps citrina]|nr:hypothetical protein E4U41_000889 [Claviceps citrina]